MDAPGARRAALLRGLLVTCAYFAAWLAFDALSSKYVAQAGASPWYLGAALSFYLVYTFGEAYIPALFVVGVLRAFIGVTFGSDPTSAYGIDALFGLEQAVVYGTAAYLLRRVLRVRLPFRDLRDAIWYVLVGCFLACALMGALGTALFVGVGIVHASLPAITGSIVTFAMGDSIGFLTLVPVLALFLTPRIHPSTKERQFGDHAIGRIEQVLLIVLLVAISMLGYHWLVLGNGAPIYYFLFLPLVWIAGRGGLRFAVIGVTCADLSVVALDAWYRLPAAQLLTYQSYIAASSLTALTLGVMVTQRWREERELSSNLERQVADRTAQLERANRDLESFAYSVSHDLRAPLRAIDGFGAALQEDAGDKLDERARDHLARIRGAADRMASLIAALLTFSEMARKEITRKRVDISEIAKSISSDLRATDAHRKVSFAIAEGLHARGEPVLIRAVLENLMNNAWKFTRNVEVTTIAVGCMPETGEFFVRDNGAGFDMTYAKRLFGAFQRLHGQDEFEGTGIGLASVARIVHRHGGAVRAEGEPGNGATFYFTLPDGAHG